MTSILGIVTIGQTLRPDLATLQHPSPSGPNGLEYPLLVRLASGTHIEVPLAGV